MNKARISLQSILLSCYLILIIAMVGNIIYDFVLPQKNEILPASIFTIIFIICFISGILNVFYYKDVSKKLYFTFMYYILLPISIPLLILEIKYKNKINSQIYNEDYFKQSNFTRSFIIVTTVLQILELLLISGLMFNFLFSDSQNLKIIGLYLLIPFCLILFGLICSWIYFLTNIRFFKIMMVFNFQLGLPWFFLSFILTRKNKNLPN